MTPVCMEVAIHHYYCNEKLPETPAVLEAEKRLIAAGIIDSNFNVTARGKKWIEMLLETPYPEHEWIDPRRYVKVDE